jgi:hypothetical protein
LSNHYTKQAAVDEGRRVAKANAPSQLVIQKADGTIETEHTYEYDPYPPPGEDRSREHQTEIWCSRLVSLLCSSTTRSTFCLVLPGLTLRGPFTTCAAFQDHARFPAVARLRIWRLGVRIPRGAPPNPLVSGPMAGSLTALGPPDCDQIATTLAGTP